jgi:hypothetical protein
MEVEQCLEMEHFGAIGEMGCQINYSSFRHFEFVSPESVCYFPGVT